MAHAYYPPLTLALFTAMAILCPPARAQEAVPHFGLPLACTPGVDCWVMNYIDMGAPDDGRASDPLCGARTYDGNKGTSFALANKAALTKDVAVLAAREGRVVRVRDGVADNLNPTADDLAATKSAQKECGNAVLIDHGNGLQSMYCYLKDGSIKVKGGDEVKKGDVIATLGMSGYTAFPQLHFGIVWEGAVMDPFTGLHAGEPCGTVKAPLWDSNLQLAYEPVRFYGTGFSTQVPTLDDLDAAQGIAGQTIAKDVPVLAYWVTLLGARAGDMLTLTITAPDGTVFARRSIGQTENKTRQLHYAGRRLDGALLAPGTYAATATLARTGDDGSVQEWSAAQSITVMDE